MEAQLLQFHKENDLHALQNYIQSLTSDFICSEVVKSCSKENGALILQVLLNGMMTTESCQEKRMMITRAVLQHLDKKLTSPKLSEKLISILATQIESYSADNIVTVMNSCLQMMKDSREVDSCNCWKDFIPKLLNKVTEVEYIEHNGSRVSGQEYKNEIIIAICINEWPDSIITNIASMFVDISLSTDQHLKIVMKLCRRMSDVRLQEIPPLVHQTLQLTKERHFMPLFLSLVELFDEKLYDNINVNSKLSQKANGAEFKETLMVEGTVLYHIYSTVSTMGPQSVKEFLKVLKDCVNTPQFILRPFSLVFLLTISCVSYTFEEEVMNILKATISRGLAEEEKLSDSAWIETVVPPSLLLNEIFEKITQNCFKDRDKVLKGLVNLGFCLLGTAKIRGRESQCDKIWSLGNALLVGLTEKYVDVTNSILQLLANQISQAHGSMQFIECLSYIARKNPLNLLDCSTVLIQLLDNICARLPGNIGQRVVSVILPLTKMSQSLRDNLIIVLRKSLFPQDKACRQMAVTGILQLLKDLKISNIRTLSQSVSQNYCGLTQIYSETAAGPGPSQSNEGMCLELLSILREVFKHQHEVKTIFYQGLYETVYVNPELGYHVLDNLQNQFDQFFISGDAAPPLHFHKTVQHQGSNVILQEPLPQLVLSMGLIVAKMEEESAKCSKLRDMFDSLCDRMAECDIPHFFLGKVACDGTAEGSVLEEQIRQILGVYEALMGYVVCAWTKDSSANGQKLYSLFKGYLNLSDYVKGLGKTDKKKSDEKGKPRKNEETQQKKKEKVKPTPFRFPESILNFKCVCRLLSLLYSPSVSWATESSSAVIKNKRELHRYCFSVLFQLIKREQVLPAVELSRNCGTGRYLTSIGKVLFTRCVKRIAELKEFDLQVAATSLECFLELINFVLIHFKDKLSNFLADITGIRIENGIRIQLKSMLDDVLDELLTAVKDDHETEVKEEEAHIRKIALTLVTCASTLAGQLPRGGSQAFQILDKLKSICKETEVVSPNVAKAILSLLLSLHIKCKPSSGFLMDLTLCLADGISLINDEGKADDHASYAIINGNTAHACLLSICDALRFHINEVDWIVSRLKSELLLSSLSLKESFETRKEEICSKEIELCRHISFAAKVLSLLCELAVPPGIYADAVLKELGNFYNKLTSVTKYFIAKVSKYHHDLISAKFDKTVKMVDHELSKNMYCFTEYVIAEGSRSTEDNSSKQLKKDPTFLKNKCLRETKIIPKVIFEKEQYQKFLLVLSNKSKIDLTGQTKHAMARDYRLYSKQVKEIIEKENIQSQEMETDGESSQTGDESESPQNKRQKLSQ